MRATANEERQIKRLIRYHSYAVKNTKNRFDPTQREGLAMVWPVRILQHYLKETKFTTQTNRNSLQSILNLTHTTIRLVQWVFPLYDYVRLRICEAMSRSAATKKPCYPRTKRNGKHLDDDQTQMLSVVELCIV